MSLKKILLAALISLSIKSFGCSIVYFIDEITGKIYVANNEDFWLDTKDYIQIIPESKNELARLWYGWGNFAQGGINSAGLFFDAAVTPKQNIPEGFTNPNGRNVGDEVLAYCQTTEQAIAYLEKEKIAVDSGHLFFGDANGNAIILEWIDGKKHITTIENNVLIATNYLLAAPEAGNFPCYRYQSIEERVSKLKQSEDPINLKSFANVISGAVQVPQKNNEGREGGTLYTSFINITDMEFILVPKLDSEKAIKLDLKTEFLNTKKKKIRLYK